MDIKSPTLLKVKGILFLFLGFLSAGIILWRTQDWIVFALLVICIWSFCRFYFFGFYVLHNYVDPKYKYAGLGDLFRYLITGTVRKYQPGLEQHEDQPKSQSLENA